MIYTVWIVSPTGYSHSRAFEDVALALQSAFIDLGHSCTLVRSSFACRGRTIILGANLLRHLPVQDYPDDMVIWNLEQIFPGSPWLSDGYINLLKGVVNGHSVFNSGKKLQVWDYSPANIEELAKFSIEAKLLEVGYAPELRKITNSSKPDIDVLHFGSINDRRIAIINALTATGVKVHTAFGVYGKERDDLIARSKIVLNVHFYESKVFEIVRCSYLMANRKCVVSEDGRGGVDYRDAIYFSPYGSIVDLCLALLANGQARGRQERRGFNIFSKRLQSEFLRPLL